MACEAGGRRSKAIHQRPQHTVKGSKAINLESRHRPRAARTPRPPWLTRRVPSRYLAPGVGTRGARSPAGAAAAHPDSPPRRCSRRSSAGYCARVAPSSTLIATPSPWSSSAAAVHALRRRSSGSCGRPLSSTIDAVEAVAPAKEERTGAHGARRCARESRRRGAAAAPSIAYARAISWRGGGRRPRRRSRRPRARSPSPARRSSGRRNRGRSPAPGAHRARTPRPTTPPGAPGRASRRACRSSCCGGGWGRGPILAHTWRRAATEWLVRSARQVALLEPDGPAACSGGEDDVVRLPAVRGAGEGQFVVAPDQLVEAAGLQEGHDLERLGAGAPHRDEERGSRARPPGPPTHPHTAACTRCRDSIDSPRLTMTSSLKVSIGAGRGRDPPAR